MQPSVDKFAKVHSVVIIIIFLLISFRARVCPKQ